MYNRSIQDTTLTKANNMNDFDMNDDVINNILYVVEDNDFQTVSAFADFQGGLHFVMEVCHNELWRDGIYHDDLDEAIEWLFEREQRLSRLNG